ncbi:ABC transporter ATP-binding protein [Nitriliruptoraceae bacterium ZYF776]|nr:ABC transporter ATP-binding protein [Profundirhabdus halotolerans]
MIEAHGVGFGYGRLPVLDGVDLSVGPGTVLGLIGPNGSGKTTLLRTLYGSLEVDEGVVRVDDTPLPEVSARELARRLSVVVQESAGDVPLTAGEMVLLGRSPHRSPFQANTRDDHRIAAAALTRVGVRHLADRSFPTLSGGERQRVLIARALAQEADHLLLDEPTNHLDIRYQHEVLHLVRDLPVTTVVVLHDLNLAARYCDRLLLLDEGRVVAAGTVDEVLVPEVLEPVYGIGVRRVDDHGQTQLLFHPLDRGPAPPSVPTSPTSPATQEVT